MDQHWLPGLSLGVVVGVLLWRLDPLVAPPDGRTAEAPTPPGEGATLVTLTLLLGIPLMSAGLAATATDEGHVVFAIALSAVLLWIATIDGRWRVIPNRLVYPLAFIAVVLGAHLNGLGTMLLGVLTEGGVFFLFFLLSVALYGQVGALGAGDVKLAAAVGLALGYPAALRALVFSVVIGAVLALVVLAVRRDRVESIPYGPAISLGAVLTLLVTAPG